MNLDPASPFLPVMVAVIAFLYSMVGHGGASGYLALLALTSLAPKQIQATALCLNIAVAGISFVAFRQVKAFNWRLTWPFLLGAVPLVAVASAIKLPDSVFTVLVAGVVLFAALRLIWGTKSGSLEDANPPPVMLAVGTGSGIGLLSGLVGVGGGIFLSPAIVLAKWGDAKTASATSALFIFVNSAVGLIVRAQSGIQLPTLFPVVLLAGVSGALAGAWFGSHKIPAPWLSRALGCVLLSAAVLILT